MMKKAFNFGCAGLLVFAVIIMLWSTFVIGLPQYEPAHSGPSYTLACYMAQDFVKDRLKAPATAKFPPASGEGCKAQQTDNVWAVSSYVDAENSYGAKLRSSYVVQMSYSPDNHRWTVVNIDILDPN